MIIYVHFIMGSALVANRSFSFVLAVGNSLFRTVALVHFGGVRDSVSTSMPLDFVVLAAFLIHVLPSREIDFEFTLCRVAGSAAVILRQRCCDTGRACSGFRATITGEECFAIAEAIGAGGMSPGS